MKSITDIEAGRARAVFRVRQKLKSDKLKWSPSGKARAFNRNSRYQDSVQPEQPLQKR